jgi:hypothetical protein
VLTVATVVALLMPPFVVGLSLSSAAGGVHSLSTRQLAAGGGTEKFSAIVASSAHCSWQSAPRIAEFAKSQTCSPGIISRSARFRMNDSPDAQSWLVTLTVSGSEKRVIRWRVSEAAPEITYSVSVASGEAQSPANPFEATYRVSADAVASAGNSSVNLAAIGKLPTGVLQLLSDGTLACSIDVGGATASGDCTIDYSALGQHSLTAQYEPDHQSAYAPFETTTATIYSYSSSTAESIVQNASSVTQNGVDIVYSSTYTVTAATNDQYGYAVPSSDGSWTFELSGLADDGNRFETTIVPPPGQLSCTITIEATLADDYTSQTSSVTSPDCSGGLSTGTGGEPPGSPGNNVPGWFVITDFASNSAGFSGSSSGGQGIICGE